MLTPSITSTLHISQSRETVSRLAHNQEIVGSTPASASNGKMRELVETSGLLNRQGITAFKGSNPFLSAASESQPLRGDAI